MTYGADVTLRYRRAKWLGLDASLGAIRQGEVNALQASGQAFVELLDRLQLRFRVANLGSRAYNQTRVSGNLTYLF